MHVLWRQSSAWVSELDKLCNRFNNSTVIGLEHLVTSASKVYFLLLPSFFFFFKQPPLLYFSHCNFLFLYCSTVMKCCSRQNWTWLHTVCVALLWSVYCSLVLCLLMTPTLFSETADQFSKALSVLAEYPKSSGRKMNLSVTPVHFMFCAFTWHSSRLRHNPHTLAPNTPKFVRSLHAKHWRRVVL